MHGLELPTQHQPLSLRQCTYPRPTVKRHTHRGSNGASRLAISADLSHPLVRAAVKEPAAFVGGIVAGLLGLNLSEDPLRDWLERTAASARGETPTGASDAAAPPDRVVVRPAPSITTGRRRRV